MGSSVNKEVPEDQNKIQERLNALRESGLSSGNSESGKNSNISNAFSDVLSKKNFTKGMAAGAAGSTFMNNIITSFIVLLITLAMASLSLASSITLTGTVRDFTPVHPDFDRSFEKNS